MNSRIAVRALHRRCRGAVALAAILAVVASPAAAQKPFPYRLRPGTDIPLAAGAIGLLAAGSAVGNNQHPLTADEVAALDPASVNPFDRSATSNWSPDAASASDILVNTLILAPVALMVTRPGSRAPLTLAVMYAESYVVANGVTGLLKPTVERIRPYAYNEDPDIPLEKKTSKSAVRSFPSGHTTQAFTAAVFLNVVYGRLHPNSSLRPWLWAGSLAAAGTVGYLRYSSGNHFPTDVIAGAAIGGLSGWAVPRLHQQDAVQVGVAPGANGVVVTLTLRH